MLAAATIALVVVLLAAAGAWTLLGGEDRSIRAQNPVQQDKPAAPQKEKEPAREAGGADQNRSEGSGAAPEQNDLPPLAQAEQAVYDLYYEMSFNDVEATWAMLSPRLQREIGSPEQWAEREDIYTFTYMRFTSYPAAREGGSTAEVTFEVRLDHTWGSETLSGTWVCVDEDGQWKLDRLKDARTVPV
jgi:hypothetical protein